MASLTLSTDAATYLGRSSKTRSSNSDNDSYTSKYSSSSDDSSETEVEVDGGGGAGKVLDFVSPEEVPEDWVPGRFRASAEFGLQYWMPYSSSGKFKASYEIDPVSTTLLETSIRLKSWVYSFDYKTSLSDPEQMKNLLAQVSRINPGAGAWWSLYAETGSVEGEADTKDQFGNPVVYPVDTEWNRVGIEWRTFQGTAIGLVYEDLTLPTILTFNNEQVAFAIFDEDTQARTLSLSLGYDRARKLLNSYKEGGAWAWALEGSIGLGWLNYSKDEARDIIEAQGYDFKSNDLLLAGALDARLGYTYSKEVWDFETQCFIGARLRASGWMNLTGDDPEPDTVELDTGFGLVTPGIFARLSFQW